MDLMHNDTARRNKTDNAWRKNAQLFVRLSSMTYDVISEEPDYRLFELFADIGGIAGIL